MKQKIQDLRDKRKSVENAELLFKVDVSKKAITKNVAISPFYKQYIFGRRETMQIKTSEQHQRVIENNEKNTLDKLISNKYNLQKW